MKRIIAFIIALLIIGKCAGAEPIPIRDVIDELLFTENRIAAVTTDMYMWLGWFSEDTDSIRTASFKAVEDLDDIKKSILNIQFPSEINDLKDKLLDALNRLQTIYKGVETKKADALKKEFLSFHEFYGQYSHKLADAAAKYRPFINLPENFDPISEETKLLVDSNDKGAYLKAISLIKANKCARAYKLLIPLLVKYKGDTFETCVLLHLSDCFNMAKSDMRHNVSSVEEGLKILSKIVNTNKYSPVLFEAFYKWRTVTQEYEHGMSNMSEIPNSKYNEKRWELIQLIKKYLATNPNDLWAQSQVIQLLSLHNIERGGPMGNHNLVDWGALFTDIVSKESNNESFETVSKY